MVFPAKSREFVARRFQSTIQLVQQNRVLGKYVLQ